MKFETQEFASGPIVGDVKITKYFVLRICPEVRRPAIGDEVTEVDKATSVLAALRGCGDVTASLATLQQAVAATDGCFLLDVTVNGERICSVRLVP